MKAVNNPSSERSYKSQLLQRLAAMCVALAACHCVSGRILGDGAEQGQPGSPAAGLSNSSGDSSSAGFGGMGGTGPSDASRPPVGTFAGPIVSSPSASSRFVRLNHAQWENTVRDALKLSAVTGLSKSFVAEPLRSTFDTNGTLLSVSADNFRDYQIAAESLASTLAHDAKLLSGIAPAGDRAALIANLGKRAFRRPLSDGELASCNTLFERGANLIGSGDAFADGVQLVASYLFQSPHFLYREELSDTEVGGKIPLSGFEVASKLAYALTGSMPDDTLFAAAEQGALQTAEAVALQARRLLATAAAAESIWSFHDQLLAMREFDQISKNASYPGFEPGVSADLRGEAKAFIADVVVRQQLGFRELMTAPYTFANARVRGLYGLSNQAPAGASPDQFSRLELDPTQRSGLLTQIGFLAANAEQALPNIIIRGVHIARRITCTPLPPPPGVVPPLPAVTADTTNRQRVDTLTKNAPCSSCHGSIINPLGFALETLDGVGQYRAQDNGQPIDASGKYQLDGKTVAFNGPVELSKAIADSDQGHSCYAQHWIEYLYGRNVDATADAKLVQQAGWLSRDKESAEELVVNLVSTDAFLSRLP